MCVCSHCVYKCSRVLPAHSACVCLFVCVCGPAAVRVAGRAGVGGWLCSACEGGMDINHREEHGSVAPGGDGWGVSAVMSP